MEPQTKTALLGDLRSRIAVIEKRPATLSTGHGGVDDTPFGNLPAGVLHEAWADHFSHCGALLGFSLGQAQRLLNARRPAIVWLQIAHEGQEYGLPYGLGLAGLGFDPTSLIVGRARSVCDLLWAGEEAASCPAVAGVLADIGFHHKALDFTATRRLSLVAEKSGTSIFLMRYGREREASAAALRWHVAAEPSGAAAFDDRAPGGARWRVRLEKGLHLSGGKAAGNRESGGKSGNRNWVVDWTENGFAIATDAEEKAGAAPLSGAAPAALGYRLPKAG